MPNEHVLMFNHYYSGKHIFKSENFIFGNKEFHNEI